MYRYRPMRIPRGHRLGTLVLYALLALAALALPLEASQPFHVHRGDTPGLYNGACALASLAAFQGAAPLPSSADSVLSAPVTETAAVAPAGCVTAALVRHTDPRAPPLA